MAVWAERRIRLDGRPFRFDEHEYLRAIYDDGSPHVVLSKAAQVGGTTWGLLRSLHACLSGLNTIYYFPTRGDALELSKSRLTPILEENAFLRRRMRDTDTAGLKRIGEAHLYMRGMKSSIGMKSVPADLIVFDELDETPPAARSMARERLAHSSYRRMIELSNPSLPDYGIDAEFGTSDQRHWTLRCAACGTWTALDQVFPRKLGEEVRVLLPREDGTVYRACPRCQGELDTEQGEWVAEHPGRPTHGYRLSQLNALRVDPAEILEEYRTTRFPSRFFNLKVGIAWADLEHRLDVASVLALCGDEPMADRSPGGRCVMGVDTGRELHVVVLGERDGTRRLLHLAVCSEFSELDALLERFRVDRCVIDGLPETHSTREFARRQASRVRMAFFNQHQRGAAKWDDTALTVVMNRTEVLDASRGAVRGKQLVLPRQTPLVEEFAKHLASDAKVLDEDPETGVKRYRYIRTGADHLSLAFTYAWLALGDRTGYFNPEDIAVPEIEPFGGTDRYHSSTDAALEWDRRFSTRRGLSR